MKNLIKTISVLIVTLSIGSSAFAYDFWTTPRLGRWLELQWRY